MRRTLLGAAAVALCACGGGSNTVDNAPPFVGTWTGTLTATDPTSGTVVDTATGVSVPITETMANTLLLSGACVDGSGPTATVTSATQFATTAPHACPPDTTETGCNSIVVTFNSLSGTLSGAMLAFTANVTGVGCGASVSENLSFTNATKN
jgi:hypothetical protein